MTVHQLRCLPEYYDLTVSEQKPWELRLNDRGYAVGDSLVLVRCPADVRRGKEDGLPRTTRVVIGVMDAGPLGWWLQRTTALDGYVMLSLAPPSPPEVTSGPAEAPKPEPQDPANDPANDATELLAEAARIIGGARQQTHGQKERSFQAIASLWSAYLTLEAIGPVRPDQVAVMMTLLKIARSITGAGAGLRDTYLDAAGYAALAGELRLRHDAYAAVDAADEAMQETENRDPRDDADDTAGT